MPLQIFKHAIAVASIRPQYWELCCRAILYLLMQDEEENEFFSLTRTQDEISVMVGEKNLQALQQLVPIDASLWLNTTSSTWHAMQIISQKTDTCTSHTVAKYSQWLSNEGISIMYLAHHTKQCILVETENVGKCIQIVQQQEQLGTELMPLNLPNSPHSRQAVKMCLTCIKDCKVEKLSMPRAACEFLKPVLKSLFFSQDKFFSITLMKDECFVVIKSDENEDDENKTRYYPIMIDQV